MKMRDYYKKMGICPMCKKKPAFSNFVHCADCLEKIALNNIKYRAKKHEEYERRNNLSKKKRYQERKEKGLCTSCGKRKKEHGMLCNLCWAKRQRSRQAREYPKRKRYGEHFRERISAGVCMYCGKEVVPGYKFCESCLQKRKRAIGTSSCGTWRKEINRQWKTAKQKHSRSS